MNHRIYKIFALAVIVILAGIILVVGAGLIAYSPKIYPEKWLKAEEKLVSFFGQVTLPIKLARLSWHPADKEILMPVYGIRIREIGDSWGAPRPDGRTHEGQDIFANRGTPVFSSTYGYVVRLGSGSLGGNYVYIAGKGGRRYYYAHLDRIADGIKVGEEVTTDTVIGFVGNTGNAEDTPYHLHFGVYVARKAINPLPFIVNRP